MPDAPRLSPPLQTRSRKTLERLVRTCERLLRRKRFDEISVAELARAGGSSVGAFYGRFRDKEALLDLLDARAEEEVSKKWDDYLSPRRWEGAGVEDIVRSFVERSVRAHRSRKGVLRAVSSKLRDRPTEEMLARARRVNRSVVEGLRALLLSRRDEIEHPHPELAIELALVMVVSMIREWIVFGELELYPTAVDDETLAAELSRAFIAYLGAGKSP